MSDSKLDSIEENPGSSKGDGTRPPTKDEIARRRRVIDRVEALLLTAVSAEALIQQDDIKLEYVLPGLVRGTLGLIVGGGSSSKSMLALYLAISVALGRDVFGLLPDHEFTRGRVIFLSLEDARVPLAARYQRLLKSLPAHLQREIIDAEEQGWIHIIPALDKALRPVFRDPRSREILFGEDLDVIRELSSGASLILVDTLSVLTGPCGLDENSNSDMGPLISGLNRIAGASNCALVLLHHVAKGDDAGAGRGASAISDNARWRLSMRPMTPDEAEKAYGQKDAEERLSWVKIEWTKQNYAPSRLPIWLRREGVQLRRDTPPVMEELPAPRGNRRPYRGEGAHG
ncbi:AAA family ATPase [Roseomonas chloroacetimidivorans]|uniref:AAA family ATPase n=1 Tax=Roseomonas chloroacetimidivorans TaxID=1766656 RepID=UPI003C73F47D